MASDLVPQAELEELVLRALFEYAQTESGMLATVEVGALLNGNFGDQRIRLALSSLDRGHLVRASHNAISGSQYSISETGYKAVEEDLLRAADRDDTSAPAANRVVGFDHNSRDYREVRKKVDELGKALRGANDLGDLSPREAAVAAFEVDQISQTLNQDFFRPVELWRRCRNTLKWISEQAAVAVVGVLATGLLTLLANLFGFF